MSETTTFQAVMKWDKPPFPVRTIPPKDTGKRRRKRSAAQPVILSAAGHRYETLVTELRRMK